MPNQPIARVEDPETREALMSLRSEFYRGLDEVVRQLNAASEKINTHIVVCTEERHSQEQWRASAQAILNDVRKSVDDHAKADEAYQASMADTMVELNQTIAHQSSNAQRWVIGVLLSLIAGSWTVIGTMIWKLVNL